MEKELEPLLEKNERVAWEKVTRRMASWADGTSRRLLNRPDIDQPHICCLQCETVKVLGEEVLVAYSQVGNQTFKGLLPNIKLVKR